MAGYDGLMPLNVPDTFDDIHPSMYDSHARLKFMDEQGIRAQVLYPNVGGFGNAYFMQMGDRDVVETCVKAFNDWITDWTSADPNRLVGVTESEGRGLDQDKTWAAGLIRAVAKGIHILCRPAREHVNIKAQSPKTELIAHEARRVE